MSNGATGEGVANGMSTSSIITAALATVVGAMLLGVVTTYQGHAAQSDVDQLVIDTRVAIEKVDASSKRRKEAMDRKLDAHLEQVRREQLEQALFRGAVMEKLGIKNSFDKI